MIGWYGPFSWLLFFFVVGIAVYLVIKYELVVMRKGGKKNSESNTEELQSPLEILEKRFARGEITEEEFERIKKRLEET